MKKSGTSLKALIHALALGIMLALASAGGHAHAPANPDNDAIYGTISDVQQPYDLDCAMPTDGLHLLHCHHGSIPPQATAPIPPDGDQPALISHPADIPGARSEGMHSALAPNRITITGPPAFILFGNFRS